MEAGSRQICRMLMRSGVAAVCLNLRVPEISDCCVAEKINAFYGALEESSAANAEMLADFAAREIASLRLREKLRFKPYVCRLRCSCRDAGESVEIISTAELSRGGTILRSRSERLIWDVETGFIRRKGASKANRGSFVNFTVKMQQYDKSGSYLKKAAFTLKKRE